MAVEDSKYRFVYIDIGSYGKDCDSAVFKRSSLWKSIENYEQQLPEAKSLPGIDSPKLPYFFIGDEAFAFLSLYNSKPLSHNTGHSCMRVIKNSTSNSAII
ncbi:protein ANTAGONIST OF LIKE HETEROCHROMATIN PROTEIN 1-like [Aphis craccivora]|uniref:Protein ANTAGONIST OF LIKE HETEROCHROMATIN PROTEIN 1-like n=1 Tax=Aphis craccivora TaxID=307492 RepID=A0A6G0X839_APHCR|nr:protein ANTAGONIST OF LIKE HETEROCHROMATIN PROTEIN 1-like [Aphis craccivora]